MHIPAWVQDSALNILDVYHAVNPQPVPSKERLEDCKIVSHRGEHDNALVLENTLAAFDQARDANVWGIELDIRWTKDLVPVICHDPTCKRLFNESVLISEMHAHDLLKLIPEIPTLETVIDRYGGDMHLMIEIKADPFPDRDQQGEVLAELLSQLTPMDDYHFLALDPALYAITSFAPTQSYLPVAELNTKRLSEIAIERKYGGLTGHFQFLNEGINSEHSKAGQSIGTGFIASKNGLFKEINRGVEWIFSNDAVKIQSIRDRYLA